ncbi:MAG TPA: response regulator transcription factor [Candidatus Scatomorpha pullicola]|nr:response regulator transcription factor [Candidatus Scatomorpha pullicola]
MADRVLIIDADMRSRTVLGRALRAAMMVTEAAVSGEDGIERIAQAEYDLVLLDIDLPGIDGFHVIQTVRQRGSRVPMVVVSSHSEDYEQLYALDLGADDYVTKPFNPVVLAAKVRALIRRSRGLPMEDIITAGPFTYNTGTLRFYKNGDEIVLSSKENAMMKLFMDNVDRIFSRSRLYDLIWGGSIVDENTVMVYISRLRAKIEDDPAKPKYIQTVRGLGYRFVAK